MWLYQKLVKTCTNGIGNFCRFVFSIYSVEALSKRFTQNIIQSLADGLSCLSLGAPLWLHEIAVDLGKACLRPPFWRTRIYPRKGLGPVTLKINNQHTLHLGGREQHAKLATNALRPYSWQPMRPLPQPRMPQRHVFAWRKVRR